VGDWFEDPAIWERFAFVMFDGKRWGEVPAVIDGMDAILEREGARRIGPGSRVLDSCCGPGRHSLELAKRGCLVTGVDRMESYLEAARESAAADGLTIDFINSDVRDFEDPAAFDLAINLFNSFGYFATREEDSAYLRRLRKSLAPGGTLILDFIGKECAIRDFIEGESFEREGRQVVTSYTVGGPWEYLDNSWAVEEGGQVFERRWRQRLYSAIEIGYALREAGFDGSINYYGSPEGKPYDENAETPLVVARAGA
jgi:SAM-dependent methyltransferase